MKVYSVTKTDVLGYKVREGEIALSSGPLVTSGLDTCVALYVSQGEKHMLSHVDASGSPIQLTTFIRENFNLEKPIKIILANAQKDDLPPSAISALGQTSQLARNVCLEAIKDVFKLDSVETAKGRVANYHSVNLGVMEIVLCENGKISSGGAEVIQRFAKPADLSWITKGDILYTLDETDRKLVLDYMAVHDSQCPAFQMPGITKTRCHPKFIEQLRRDHNKSAQPTFSPSERSTVSPKTKFNLNDKLLPKDHPYHKLNDADQQLVRNHMSTIRVENNSPEFIANFTKNFCQKDGVIGVPDFICKKAEATTSQQTPSQGLDTKVVAADQSKESDAAILTWTQKEDLKAKDAERKNGLS